MLPRKKTNVAASSADVLVIGGGGSGLAAGVAAAELGGLKIIVLEKRATFGGNTALSLGPFAADSPVQKRKAIDARKEDLFKIAMDWAHWKVNPKIVRAFIDKSGNTIEWLQEKGLEFDCLPLYPNQTKLTWHMTEGYGAEITRTLYAFGKQLGVTMLSKTPAKKILIGAEGKVRGVVVENNGEEYEISAKSIIIATGGYGGNKELLRKYCKDYNENMECDGVKHTGDGLLMAMEIGAANEGLGLLLLSGPQIPQEVSMKLGTPPNQFIAPLMAVALEPDALWLNKKGERFIDEAASYHHFSSSNAVNRQPENLCFTILDQKMVENKEKRGLFIGLGRPSEEERTRMPGLEREFKKLAKKGWIKIADTWDEIAGWIGADPEVLKATVKTYNDACDSGYDAIFAKDRRYLSPLKVPPYYAIKGNSDFLDTIGGIKINEKMEGLDKQDKPIPGLFAVGVAAGGWQADTYCDVLSGAASGFAFNSGRIAAENAVKFAKAN